MSTATARLGWTTNFRHLVNDRPRMFESPARRSPSAPEKAATGLVHPRNRIKFWNIIVGDKIGIFRGHHKPPQEERDRVFEVGAVDKRSNFVLIKDVKPKRRYQGSKLLAPVHYSNVGLYMGKFPVNERRPGGSTRTVERNVFATRIVTDIPRWDSAVGHFVWRRYAASTWPAIGGYEKLRYEERRRGGRTRELVEIPWPVQKRPEPVQAHAELDTTQENVQVVSWEPSSRGMRELGPLQPTAFPPKRSPIEQEYLDAVMQPVRWKSLLNELPMEVFLVSEIANPHSRMHKQKRWQQRQIAADTLRTQMIQREMKDLRGRKRAVARREAIFRWTARMEREKAEKKHLAWIKRGGLEDEARNEKRKMKRTSRSQRKLRDLVLTVQDNQYIPLAAA